MSRPLRIGLLAEGEAELGPSVPYLKPEEGGKPIDPTQEGALHILIRRELARIDIPDCQFIHRHPSGEGGNQRPLRVRWNLAQHLDLDMMRSRCPEGYGAFSQTLLTTAKTAMAIVQATEMS